MSRCLNQSSVQQAPLYHRILNTCTVQLITLRKTKLKRKNWLFSTVVSLHTQVHFIAGKHEISALTLLKFRPRKTTFKVFCCESSIILTRRVTWNHAISPFCDVFEYKFCEKIIFSKKNYLLYEKNVNNKDLKGSVVNRRCQFINKNQSKLRICTLLLTFYGLGQVVRPKSPGSLLHTRFWALQHGRLEN